MTRLELRADEMAPPPRPWPPRAGASLSEWAAFRRLRDAPPPRPTPAPRPPLRLRRRATPPPREWLFAPPMVEPYYAPPLPLYPAGRPKWARILARTAAHYGLGIAEMLAVSRRPRVVRPRQIAMYLAYTLMRLSLPEIGRRFSGRDHTTVLHAVRKIAAEIAGDPAFAAEIAALTAEIADGEMLMFPQWGVA